MANLHFDIPVVVGLCQSELNGLVADGARDGLPREIMATGLARNREIKVSLLATRAKVPNDRGEWSC